MNRVRTTRSLVVFGLITIGACGDNRPTSPINGEASTNAVTGVVWEIQGMMDGTRPAGVSLVRLRDRNGAILENRSSPLALRRATPTDRLLAGVERNLIGHEAAKYFKGVIAVNYYEKPTQLAPSRDHYRWGSLALTTTTYRLQDLEIHYPVGSDGEVYAPDEVLEAVAENEATELVNEYNAHVAEMAAIQSDVTPEI